MHDCYRRGMTSPSSTSEPEQPSAMESKAGTCATIALLLLIFNPMLFFVDINFGILFGVLIPSQLVLGVLAVIWGRKSLSASRPVGAFAAGVAALELAVVTVLPFLFGGMGGAWGRPLRIRGRQVHPNLRQGSDWTRGQRPHSEDLDDPTRRALEALWLHDAQKEHASVPAFSRISWMLAAVGAPAELVEWSHRAALEEIEHTRLCFALAAGYGERSHSVEPMPELLLGFDTGRDPLITLAVESLGDGCQLEDFNADVAAECARVCREPITRGVLETIAVEERSHAEFSWALLEWLLARDADRVRPALEEALARLVSYPRPTAVAHDKLALVAAADGALLRSHGRLPDERWAELWDARLTNTIRRVRTLLDNSTATKARNTRLRSISHPSENPTVDTPSTKAC